MADPISMKDLVTYVAQALVDHPEQVAVSELEGEQTSVFELRVAPEDLGKVIGKQGRIAKAIRSVVKAATLRGGKPVFVEIQ